MTYWQPAVVRDLALDRHCVIEASAGTGKTYTITHLTVAMLLADVPLEQILCVTFTEKATAELRVRVRALIEQLCYGPSGDEVPGSVAIELDERARALLQKARMRFEQGAIFTIHGFCQRVLSEFAFDCGVPFNLEVTDGRLSFHRAFRAALRRELAGETTARLLLEAWFGDDGGSERPGVSRVDELERLLYQAHILGYEPPEPPTNDAGEPQRAIVDAFLPAVANRLDADKRRRGEVDYDDMLAWVWRALEGPRGAHLAAALRARYRFALVDEFQDTDDLQWQIFHRIFVAGSTANHLKNRLIVVGDPKQAIYSFRGADVFTYLRARHELLPRGRAPVRLTQNFRSTSGVIAACNYIFGEGAGLLTGAIGYDTKAVCALPERRLLTAAKVDAAPVVLMKYQSAGTRSVVGDVRSKLGMHIAEMIHRLLNRDEERLTVMEPDGSCRALGASDIFILTRSHAESAQIGGYLRSAGVPFAYYKQDKLFQSTEARYTLDVLRAIAAPERRATRLRAWVSPFFGLKFGDLLELGEPPATHPLNERLYRWRTMAEAENFPELFSSLLYRSGLADRELFASDSELALVNYQHIFDVLLEQAIMRRLSLDELVELMADYVAQRATPPGESGNLQRMPPQREAVQVMTIHVSKGLEAEIVIPYGGLSRGNQERPPVAVYHEGWERRFAFGAEQAGNTAGAALKQERDQEEGRLLYVALTRARSRLYLPVFPNGTTTTLTGFYAPLNKRLNQILEERSGGDDRAGELRKIFAVEDIHLAPQPPAPAAEMDLSSWEPPAALLEPAGDWALAGDFQRLRRERAPMAMRSYTQLRAAAEADGWRVSLEDFKSDAQTTDQPADLPGGRLVGIMLHEILERVDLETLAASRDLNTWRNLPEVRTLVRDCASRQRVQDPQWLERAPELVYRALAARLVFPDGRPLGPLCRARTVREMEFIFPIPERGHQLLSTAGEGWRAERGYFKGFIDLVFEHQGRFYFADWKSDQLASYDPARLAAYVSLHYGTQALIYTTGVLRLLSVRDRADYEARFGGLLYLFVRGLGPDSSSGVYFHRPEWDEVCRGEAVLMELGDGVAHARG